MQIDLAVSLAMMFFAFGLVLTYSGGFFELQADIIRDNELESVAITLSERLQTELEGNLNQIQMLFTENGSYPHTETLTVNLRPPNLADINVYDTEWNVIPSTNRIEQGKVIVSFDQEFLSGESKYLYLIYSGTPTSSIEYIDAPNITAVLLSERVFTVFSRQRCNVFNSRSYQQNKELLGSDHNFRFELPGCSTGSSPPNTTVIVKRIPLLLEQTTVSPLIGVLSVW